MIPVDDVEYYPSFYEMEKAGTYLYFLQCGFTVASWYFFSFFFFSHPGALRMRLHLSGVVKDSNKHLRCDWRLVSENYKRPFVRVVSWVYWLQNSIQWAPAELCAVVTYVESVWVSAYTAYKYVERWRLREDEDGLVKCYSVLLHYSHYLLHRSGCAATVCGPHRSKQTGPPPSGNCPAH